MYTCLVQLILIDSVIYLYIAGSSIAASKHLKHLTVAPCISCTHKETI